MKLNLFFVAVFVWFLGFAQYTHIPDGNFEQALIDLGYDDVLDNQVLTENINQISELVISEKNIADLTGIQDFYSLESLDCSSNNLENINVSNLIELKILKCQFNQISEINLQHNLLLNELYVSNNLLNEIDVSANSMLSAFDCSANLLNELNLSNNLNLNYLSCATNQISELDLSSNLSLTFLLAYVNKLEKLNIGNLNFEHLVTVANPDLYCINSEYEYIETPDWEIDPWTEISQNCDYMSINNENLDEIYFYPNPTKNILNFSETLKEISIYDLSGKLIKKGNGTQINVSNLSKGTYLLKGITNSGKRINQKFIKN